MFLQIAPSTYMYMDTEFKRYHMDIIDSFDDESEIER